MSIRNDMITRKAFRYHLQLKFFDVDARKDVETYITRCTRKNEEEMIRDEFQYWTNSKPYILTTVNVMKTEKVLFGMEPVRFYDSAEVLSCEEITDEDKISNEEGKNE